MRVILRWNFAFPQFFRILFFTTLFMLQKFALHSQVINFRLFNCLILKRLCISDSAVCLVNAASTCVIMARLLFFFLKGFQNGIHHFIQIFMVRMWRNNFVDLDNFVFNFPLIKKVILPILGGKLIWKFDDFAPIVDVLTDELRLDVGRMDLNGRDGVKESGYIFLNSG